MREHADIVGCSYDDVKKLLVKLSIEDDADIVGCSHEVDEELI
jgi:hypothetical protein